MRVASVLLVLVLATGCFDNRRAPRDGAVPLLDGGHTEIDAAPPGDAGGRCGDGVREAGEACDGSDLGGASCESRGLGSGTLACDETCAFDGAGCASCTPSCSDRDCGTDGCGGSCGSCAASEGCSGEGLCVCAPACDGLECGDDDCGGSCGSCGVGESCEAGACVSSGGALILTEVFYNAVGGDDQLEWVELYNAGSTTIDLSGYSLGAGGADYTYSVYQLTGTIAAGGCRVVGGPISSASNGSPTYAQSLDFFPDIQNSGSAADGIALFAVPATAITASTVPMDAVIYGTDNVSSLLDETGAPGAVDVESVAEGGSIQRTASGWRTQSFPDPNDCTL